MTCFFETISEGKVALWDVTKGTSTSQTRSSVMLVNQSLNFLQQFNGCWGDKKGQMCTHSYVIIICTALETAA